MSIVTLDFETYYSQDYSLTKLTMEEYIRHQEFETIMVAIKINNQNVIVYDSPLDAPIKWEEATVLCHNTAFDAFILAEKYGIHPAHLLDTKGMAAAAVPFNVSKSLASLANYFGIGEKGTEVINAKGKRKKDFTDLEYLQYAQYCINDVVLTYNLYQILAQHLPESEIQLIDLTLRMFTNPQLRLSTEKLETHKAALATRKQDFFTSIAPLLPPDTDLQKALRSKAVFSNLLTQYGAEIPYKTSPTTGLDIPALSKTDPGFQELLESPIEEVSLLANARLGVNSSIEESRTERLIGVSKRGKLPILLNYYGAHTGRFSGGEKLNLQNIPRNSPIKEAIEPPPGYSLVHVDLSNIELRMNFWFAQEQAGLDQFISGRDLYCDFASKIFGRTITKEDKKERFIGKTCMLGLGFQTGHIKLHGELKKNKIQFSESECKTFVDIFRTTYPNVKQGWANAQAVIQNMMNPSGYEELFHGLLPIVHEGLQLPNGLYLKYPGLHLSGREYTYYGINNKPTKLFGGKIIENIIQALARIVLTDAVLRIKERYTIPLTIHDAIYALCKKEEEQECLDYLIKEVCTPPKWCNTLPLKAEGSFGNNLAECK